MQYVILMQYTLVATLQYGGADSYQLYIPIQLRSGNWTLYQMFHAVAYHQ